MPAVLGASGGYYQPPKIKPISTSPLAAAASGGNSANPFGLSGANSMRDAQTGYATAPIAAAAAAPKAPSVQTMPATTPTVAPQPAAAPPTPGTYDINTDPTLQSITALTGLSDQDANAAALKQRVQQVIAYGDPTLAAAVLGSSDPNVQAASANPNSTVAQINTQYGQNLHNLDEQLNQDNLGYSGYRITQDQQAATDKASQLANAANSVEGNLDTIDSNLSSTLDANQAQRIAAANDAANRLAAAASTAAPTSTTSTDPNAAAPITDYGAPGIASDTGGYSTPGNAGGNPIAQAIAASLSGNDWNVAKTLGNDWVTAENLGKAAAPAPIVPTRKKPLL